MTPDPKEPQANRPEVSHLLRKAHAKADQVYQALTRPDRPLEPETGKKPWLAALLSFVIVGSGQLYNRQLAKGLLLALLFYPLGLVVLIAYALLNWAFDLRERSPELPYILAVIWGSLWLFAVVDAFLVARALRAGRLVVRYGFVRQGVHMAAGWVPFVGAVVPSEAVAPEDVNMRVDQVVQDLARDKAVEWVVRRVLRYGCLGLGLLLMMIGLIAAVQWLVTGGGLIVVAGILLHLA